MTDDELRAISSENFYLAIDSTLFKSLVDELLTTRQNLTSTQERCNELLEENRALIRREREIRTRWADLLGCDGKMP